MTQQQQFDYGLSYHQAGRLGEEETSYRRVLTQQPNQTDVLGLLGALAVQMGRLAGVRHSH